MSTNQETTKAVAAADLPQPTPTLAPEVVVEQLRNLRGQIGEVAPLTSAQRRALRTAARTTNPVLQASINVIGALDNVAQAVGQPADDVRQLYDEANRWTAVEDELRTMLNGVSARTSSAGSAWRWWPRRRSPSVRSWRATRPTPCSCRMCRRSSV